MCSDISNTPSLQSVCRSCCPGYGFSSGGVVPGPLGAALTATVHGGELVVPAGKWGGHSFGMPGVGGPPIVHIHLEKANIYGIEDLQRTILSTITQAHRRGGLGFLKS